MKSWFEIRWRQLLGLTIILGVLGAGYAPGRSSPQVAHGMLGFVALLWLLSAVLSAGAGVKTQSAFQSTKGLHGSTYFTLSLPVSRFRLLAVRAGIGMSGLLGIILITSSLAWILFPLGRAGSTPLDFLKWVFTVSCCAAGFHAISLLISTFLDEQWHIWGTMIVIGALRLATYRFPPPDSVDIFRVVTDASPLSTHTLPWPAISVSLGLAGILFFIAARIVQTREY